MWRSLWTAALTSRPPSKRSRALRWSIATTVANSCSLSEAPGQERGTESDRRWRKRVAPGGRLRRRKAGGDCTRGAVHRRSGPQALTPLRAREIAAHKNILLYAPGGDMAGLSQAVADGGVQLPPFGVGGAYDQHAFSGPRRAVERLPAYAPELNPVEYIWGYWKQHELPNFRPNNLPSLAAKPVADCAACGAVPASSAPAGNKPSSLTILYKSQ
jgi:hypothetical protein